MILDVRLGHNAEYTLSYDLFDTRVSERVWNRVNFFDQEFVSRTEFHNFGESRAEIRNKMNASVQKIKQMRPNVFTDADDLNALHKNFPDMMKTAEGDLKNELSAFNYYLHHLEDFDRGKVQDPWFLCAAKNDDGEPLEKEDYNLFTPIYMKNHLYMNYPHIGKHLLEIYYDKDLDVPEDHIKPHSLIKNTFVCWLGRNGRPWRREALTEKVKNFCKKIEHKLPYDINDKRLAIGHLPLGRLAHTPDMDKVFKNQYVHSIGVR